MRNNQQPSPKKIIAHSTNALNKIRKQIQIANRKKRRNFNNMLSHYSKPTRETEAATRTSPDGIMSALAQAVDPEVQNRDCQDRGSNIVQWNVADTGSRVNAKTLENEILKSLLSNNAASKRPCLACALRLSVTPELIQNLEASLIYFKALYEAHSFNHAAVETQHTCHENQVKNTDLCMLNIFPSNHDSSPSWKTPGFGKVELLEKSGVWINAEVLKALTVEDRNNPIELTRTLMKHLIGIEELSQLCAIGEEGSEKKGVDPNLRRAVKYYVEMNSVLNGKRIKRFNAIINGLCAQLRSKTYGKGKNNNVHDSPPKRRGRPSKKLKLSSTNDELQATNDPHCRLQSHAKSPSLVSASSIDFDHIIPQMQNQSPIPAVELLETSLIDIQLPQCLQECDQQPTSHQDVTQLLNRNSQPDNRHKETPQTCEETSHPLISSESENPSGPLHQSHDQLIRCSESNFQVKNLHGNYDISTPQRQTRMDDVQPLTIPSSGIQLNQSQFYQQFTNHPDATQWLNSNSQPNNRPDPAAATLKSVKTAQLSIPILSMNQSRELYQSQRKSIRLHDVSKFPVDNLRQSSHNWTMGDEGKINAVQTQTTSSLGIQPGHSQTQFYQQDMSYTSVQQLPGYNQHHHARQNPTGTPHRSVVASYPLTSRAPAFQSGQLHQSQHQSVGHFDVSQVPIGNQRQIDHNSMIQPQTDIHTVQLLSTPSAGNQLGQSQQWAGSHQDITQLAGYNQQQSVYHKKVAIPRRRAETTQPLILTAPIKQLGQSHQFQKQLTPHPNVTSVPLKNLHHSNSNSIMHVQNYIHNTDLTTPSLGIQSNQFQRQNTSHQGVTQSAGYNHQHSNRHDLATTLQRSIDTVQPQFNS